MSEAHPFKSVWEQSITRQFLRWLFSWRIVRRILFVFAALITAYGVFYTVENWSGKRAWDAYERELTAQGVVLDFQAFVPPSIPEESNFAATPYFADLFKGTPSRTNSAVRWPDLFAKAERHAKELNPALRRTRDRELTDLVAWQIAFRNATRRPADDLKNSMGSTNAAVRADAGAEILRALSPYDPVLQELHSASARPASRYPVHYDLDNPWGILLPHIHVVKETSLLLALKASAELAITNTTAAVDDLRLMLRLLESLEGEPFLISHLVGISCLQSMLNTLWEGISLQRWSDSQLAEVQARMAKLNYVRAMRRSMEAERSTANVFVDLMKKQRNKMELLAALDPNPTPGGIPFVGWLIPIGWFEFERLNHVKLFQSYFMPASDATNRTIAVAFAKNSERTLEQRFQDRTHVILHHEFLAKALLPALANIHTKVAHGQAAVNEAVIACALERCRRARGEYPPELKALVPEFLPQLPLDPINGGAMRYTAQAPVRIYSIGWDEKDDGGTPAGPGIGDKGDWVWRAAN